MGSGTSKPRADTVDHQGGLASYFRQALVKVHGLSGGGGIGLAVGDHYDGLNSVPIGKGSFGEVRKVKHRSTGKVYACKAIRIPAVDKKKRDELLKEMDIMRKFDHPNVIKVVEVFMAPAAMHIIMEYAGGGELFDRLADNKRNPDGRFSETIAKMYLLKMLRALNYLHCNKIAHRDLKLENFLLSHKGKKSELKLIDFGYSREYLETNREKQLVGTPYYMAPELFAGQYDPFVADVWSLGCILYMMVTGELPISGGSTQEIFERIKFVGKEPKPRKFGKIANKVVRISTECQTLINRMMNVDPQERIKINEALNDPWFKSRRQPLDDMSSNDEDAPYDSGTALKLTKYKQFPDLKRAALMVAAFYLPEDDLEALGHQFVQMDKDCNGILSYDEFHEALAKKLKAVDPQCDVREHFDAIDLDQTMGIQYTEFIAACIEEKNIQNQQHVILTAFKAFDTNDDGKITKDELRKRLGDAVSSDMIDMIIDDCDVLVQDGEIDEEEFANAVRGGRLTTLANNTSAT